MPTILNNYGNVTTLETTSLNSLANNTLFTSGPIDNTSNKYDDYLIELFVASFTPSGNQICFLYVIPSLDGTSYATVSASNLGVAANLGHLPLLGSGGWRSRPLSVRAACENMPPYFKIGIYTDNGASWAASGNALIYRAAYRSF